MSWASAIAVTATACGGAAAVPAPRQPPEWGTVVVDDGTSALAPSLREERIAIVGLVVHGAAPTAEDFGRARELTDALRTRVRTGTTDFVLGPGSDRELDLDELAKARDCAADQPACVAAIGDGLGVDAVLYGTSGRDGDAGVVELRLLDVANATVVRRVERRFDPADQRAAVIRWAAELLANGDVGALVVEANVAAAIVYVDDHPLGHLTAGATRLDRIAAGSHALAIEAAGRARGAVRVTVTPYGTTTVTFTLR